MSDFKFSPSDFTIIYKKIFKDGFISRSAGDMWEPDTSTDEIAKIANAKLAEWLSTGVKVYTEGQQYSSWSQLKSPRFSDTHEALLINIKPIERECEHVIDVPKLHWADLGNELLSPCAKCGKRLKAKWELMK